MTLHIEGTPTVILLAASITQVAAVLVGVVAVVAVMSWLLKRRRSDVWRELAQARGLTFVDQSTGPHITGRIDGRRVDVRTEEEGSDHDVGGVAVVRIALALAGVPQEMTAEGVPGLIGDLATLTEERIEFADEHFTRDVLVQGRDDDRIRRYWSDARRRAFLQLVERAPCDQITLLDGSLVAELRDIVSDRNQLDQLLDMLLSTATALDGSTNESAE